MSELNERVEMFYAWDWKHERPWGEGRVVAIMDAPSVCVEFDDGTRSWWRRDLVRPSNRFVRRGGEDR